MIITIYIIIQAYSWAISHYTLLITHYCNFMVIIIIQLISLDSYIQCEIHYLLYLFIYHVYMFTSSHIYIFTNLLIYIFTYLLYTFTCLLLCILGMRLFLLS